jgi:hypothetical protein
MTSTTSLSDNSPGASLPRSIIKRTSNPKIPVSGTKMGAELGGDFQLSDYSVLCCRGKDSVNHVGNRRFRILASMYVAKYSQADSKAAKSVIVSEIITAIRQVGGNFCKQKRGTWFEVGEHCAREKVSALLRDLLHTQYRSSNKSKIANRRARRQSQNQQSGQKLVDGAADSDDSSLSSSCWGSTKDYLGLEHSPEFDFFDIDVFSN